MVGWNAVGETRGATIGRRGTQTWEISDQTASETKGNEGSELYLEYCMVRLSWPARKAPLSILFNLTSTNSRLWINALSLNAPVSISRIDALLMVTLKIVMAQKAFLRITFVQISSMRTSATADGNTAVGNSVILTLWNIICAKGIREIEIIEIRDSGGGKGGLLCWRIAKFSQANASFSFAVVQGQG